MKLIRRIIFLFAPLVFAAACLSAESWITADSGVIVYDAPSEKARAEFVLGARYPLRGLASVYQWEKIEMPDGGIGWVQRDDVIQRRAAVVRVERATVFAEPNANSDIVFAARKGVILLATAEESGGWVQISHLDGEIGYVESGLVWRNY